VVKIVVTRALPESALAALGELGDVWVNPNDRPLARSDLRRVVAGAAALVTMPSDTVDEAVLDAAGKGLRIVANYAVGYDNIDLEACRARGIAVANTPDTLVETTADLAFGLILAAPRRIAEGDRHIRAGRPWEWRWDFMLGRDVSGATLGIVGLGAIGRAVARRAQGFSMRIIYTNRSQIPKPVERQLGAQRVTFDELLDEADIITLHCPLTPETRHLIDAHALARMKETAILVNTARGPIVDEAALAAALQRRQIAGAGLDVFEREPAVHPGLLARENVVLVPHLGSATYATRERMAMRAVANVQAVLSGQPVPDDLIRAKG
jgi:lactate dehydrogenase-like 2-hydroxyacid dehydrogenase